MSTEKTKVIFRYWRGEVIALFPEIPSDSYMWFNCLSYMHMGQHSAASPRIIIYNSRPATPDEYADLKQELESIGYDLDVRQRLTNDMTRMRQRNWNREQ